MKRLLLLALACAPARKPMGELRVAAVNVSVLQDPHAEASFRIETARIVAPAGRLDLVVTEDGCLRGDRLNQPAWFCPLDAEPGDPKGLYRFHSVGHEQIAFAVRLLEFGDKLRVEAGPLAAEMPLPAGPAADEIRRHPELLGAAFALGLFPASSDPRELWSYRVVER